MSTASSKRPLSVENDDPRIVPISLKHQRGVTSQCQPQVQNRVQVPLTAGTSKANPPLDPDAKKRKELQDLGNRLTKWTSQMPEYIQPAEADLDPARYRNVEMSNVRAHERSLVIRESLALLNSPRDSYVLSRTFSLGGLVWARCKGYPFYPAMVCLNPLVGDYSLAYEKLKNGRQVSVHLLYFGDEQYMQWAPIDSIFHYAGWERFRRDLLSKIEDSKSDKRRKILQSMRVSSKRLPNWRLSVGLADMATGMTPGERLCAFTIKL